MRSSPSPPDLSALGLAHTGAVHAHLPPAALVELALARGEARLSDRGALAATTGKYTGRSPKDRYLLAGPEDQGRIAWGAVNRPLDAAVVDRLHARMAAHLQGHELFVCDASACADERYRLPVRVVADLAWHALFAGCLLRDPAAGAADFDP